MSNDRIRDVLAAHGRLAVDVKTLDDDDDLYVAGLTSHASVNVMLALEDSYDVEFPEQLLRKTTFSTVSSIRSAVDGLVSAGVSD
jgi:acyl carrier protein